MAPRPMAATTTKPNRPGIWKSTGTTPAVTHPSWNLVSNCANARPRFASGASRCTIDSNARREIAAEKFTAPANRTAPTVPPRSADRVPTTAMIASPPCSIVSSRSRSRMRGASALPAIVSRLAKPSARPNHTSPASW